MKEGFNPISVANEIIRSAHDEGEFISPMKLQKLLFFTHGYNLALNNFPAISEDFEAWPYGPVAPSVYDAYSRYGGNPIIEPIEKIGLRSVPDLRHAAGAGGLRAVLQNVWEVLGRYSALKLSEMTHYSDSPWATVVAGLGVTPKVTEHVKIPDSIIKEYCQRLVTRA